MGELGWTDSWVIRMQYRWGNRRGKETGGDGGIRAVEWTDRWTDMVVAFQNGRMVSSVTGASIPMGQGDMFPQYFRISIFCASVYFIH